MTNSEKIQSWEKHLSRAQDQKLYSMQRIDLLIISISGACIFIVFEILRFLKTTPNLHLDPATILLKISAICSVIAIGVNFLSQIFAYHANRFEVIFSRMVINQLDEDKMDDVALKPIEDKISYFNKFVVVTNIVSTSLMTIGIILLVVFNLVTF